MTFFDLEKQEALALARTAAAYFAARHYCEIWDASDVEAEASAIALEFYNSPKYKKRFVFQRVLFSLSHALEKAEKNVRRNRDGHAPLVKVDDQEVLYSNAVAPTSIPLDLALDIGQILLDYTPPIAAAITDVLNGYTITDALKRNNLKYRAFAPAFASFKNRVKGVL